MDKIGWLGNFCQDDEIHRSQREPGRRRSSRNVLDSDAMGEVAKITQGLDLYRVKRPRVGSGRSATSRLQRVGLQSPGRREARRAEVASTEAVAKVAVDEPSGERTLRTKRRRPSRLREDASPPPVATGRTGGPSRNPSADPRRGGRSAAAAAQAAAQAAERQRQLEQTQIPKRGRGRPLGSTSRNKARANAARAAAQSRPAPMDMLYRPLPRDAAPWYVVAGHFLDTMFAVGVQPEGAAIYYARHFEGVTGSSLVLRPDLVGMAYAQMAELNNYTLEALNRGDWEHSGNFLMPIAGAAPLETLARPEHMGSGFPQPPAPPPGLESQRPPVFGAPIAPRWPAPPPPFSLLEFGRSHRR